MSNLKQDYQDKDGHLNATSLICFTLVMGLIVLGVWKFIDLLTK